MIFKIKILSISGFSFLTGNSVVPHFLILICFFLILSCNDKSEKSTIDYPWENEWTEVFFDDFEGTALDNGSWTAILRGGAWNNEDQAYDPDNAVVKDGELLIISRNEDWSGPINLPHHPDDGLFAIRDYTSAQVESRDKKDWLYGRFECRAKMGVTPGMLCAIWMMPSDLTWPPEIDIAEVLSGDDPKEDPSHLYMTNHYGTQSNHLMSNGSYYAQEDLTADWHVYAIEWEPGIIRWYLDGKECFSTKTGVPDKPLYFIMCSAIGPDWTEDPTVDSVFPVEMRIDWVRVSQKSQE